MRKYMIISCEDNHAVAMSPNGDFCNIKVKNAAGVGEYVFVRPPAFVVTIIMIVLTLFLTTIGGCGVLVNSVFFTPYTYFSVDINPSVEFALNAIGKVIAINGVNKDGDRLIQHENFMELSAEQAARKVVELSMKAGYIDLGIQKEKNIFDVENDVLNAVLITVASDKDDEAQKVKDSVREHLNAFFDNTRVLAVVITENISRLVGDFDEVSNSEKVPSFIEGVSLGKMILIDRLCKVYGDEVKPEELKKSSIKDLNQMLINASKDRDINCHLLKEEYKSMVRNNRCKYLAHFNNVAMDKNAFLQYKSQYFKDNANIVNNVSINWQKCKENWMNNLFNKEVA